MLNLIVTIPFGGYAKGARISDADKVAAILAGPSRHHVVKVSGRQSAPAPKRIAAPAA